MAGWPEDLNKNYSRLKMECIGCPPDQHPAEWFCSWRFYLPR